jgi:hypothetical protein
MQPNCDDCSPANATGLLRKWLAATHNNTLTRRAIVVDAWAHVGIGHSVRSNALWLRLLTEEASSGGAPRSLRFAACVPARYSSRFTTVDAMHAMPSCGASVTDPETKLNASRTAFDASSYLTFASVPRLRAHPRDFYDFQEVHSATTCQMLRAHLRAAQPRVVFLYGSSLRDLLHRCVREALLESGAAAPECALSCLRHVGLTEETEQLTAAPIVPPCDVGLHLRSMKLDDGKCNLLLPEPGPQQRECEYNWRARRCSNERGVSAIATGCPGRHRFATSDTPSLYGFTRPLEWSDLNESATITWNEAVDADFPAPLGDVRSTMLAFVTLSRCRTAIIAPVSSHFSDTAALAAGVPLVGCCSELVRSSSTTTRSPSRRGRGHHK